jgi:hypothetical protein
VNNFVAGRKYKGMIEEESYLESVLLGRLQRGKKESHGGGWLEQASMSFREHVILFC